jgi:xanthine dehydrogenase large subunit
MSMKDTMADGGTVGKTCKHESAEAHVSGRARYIDDIPEHANTLHLAVGQSTVSNGVIAQMDLDAVRCSPGVVCVLTAKDVPGQLDIGPVFPGDLLLTDEIVEYIGQPIFIVAARSHYQARVAARLGSIDYEQHDAEIEVDAAIESGNTVRPVHIMAIGDPDAVLEAAPFRRKGQFRVGGQEHFYLEGQAAMALPQEDGGMVVMTSNQNPTEVQKLVAEVLGLPMHKIVIDVRRMGGGFGGKETHANPWACMTALVAWHTGLPAKCRLSRADDMIMTGKRHDFLNSYDIGFDADGQILAVTHDLAGRCGNSPDLSDAIVDRAMFHCDNAYWLPNARAVGHRYKTNTVSNTAFRGFGGPQGMMAAEAVIDEIARATGLDPLTVRKRNLYKQDAGQKTPYHQEIEHFTIPQVIEQLESESKYWERREAIRLFNIEHATMRKGLALTPVKFGISFTVTHLNQASALVHVYTDGSIHLNHGGTEMGQGLFTKISQIVADVFAVDVDTVAVSATRTDKVPNTSPTAASAGTDLNGMAAKDAANTIRERMIEYAVGKYSLQTDQIRFADSQVYLGDVLKTFSDFANECWLNRIQLSATGFYKTPKIHYNRETAAGRPFFYYANGAAVSEVIVDTLTGEYKLTAVDIIHDVGDSLNPAIDIGQIEGGFVQGLGWLTTEELKWNAEGRLLSTGPATYKIPAIADVPEHFNVRLLEGHPNREPTIYHSKAVGEPPLMLAISVWCALCDAVSSIGSYRLNPRLDAPATCEKVLFAIEEIQQRMAEE